MRNKKTPALVNLAIYTTITIFLWIFFDIYRALRKPAIVDVDEKTLEPVNPNLDKNLLNELKDSIYFDESTLYNPGENISPTEVPVSTKSAETNTNE